MLNEGGGPWGGRSGGGGSGGSVMVRAPAEVAVRQLGAAARAMAARAGMATGSARATLGASPRASARVAAADAPPMGPSALDELLKRGRDRLNGGWPSRRAAATRSCGRGARSPGWWLLWILVDQRASDRPPAARRYHAAREICGHAAAGPSASPSPRRSIMSRHDQRRREFRTVDVGSHRALRSRT